MVADGLNIPSKLWCGVTFFICPYERCGWTHQNRAEVKLHFYQAHLQRVLDEQDDLLRPGATLYDAEGKLITRMPTSAPVIDAETVRALFYPSEKTEPEEHT